MEIAALLSVLAIFLVSARKFIIGITNIRKYKTSKLVLHAFLVTWTGTTIIIYTVLTFIERL